MKKEKMYALNNHFKLTHFEISKHSNNFADLLNSHKQLKFEYGIGILEVANNEIIPVGLTNEIETSKTFENCIDLLPSLNLHDVAIVFALTNNDSLDFNPFKIDDRYPSEFAKELLKDTYGNIIFNTQLIQLLRSSVSAEEDNSLTLDEYRRGFNHRSAKTFDKINNLYLPDGYPLQLLLEKYTPVAREERESYGFTCAETHKLAYEFIVKSKKYFLK